MAAKKPQLKTASSHNVKQLVRPKKPKTSQKKTNNWFKFLPTNLNQNTTCKSCELGSSVRSWSGATSWGTCPSLVALCSSPSWPFPRGPGPCAPSRWVCWKFDAVYFIYDIAMKFDERPPAPFRNRSFNNIFIQSCRVHLKKVLAHAGRKECRSAEVDRALCSHDPQVAVWSDWFETRCRSPWHLAVAQFPTLLFYTFLTGFFRSWFRFILFYF